MNWSPEFQTAFADFVANPNAPNAFKSYSRREYLVPVFNRGQALTFEMLVASETAVTSASVDITHTGVILQFSAPDTSFWGVPTRAAVWRGLFISAIAYGGVALYTGHWVAPLFLFVIAEANNLVGVALYRLQQRVAGLFRIN